MANEILGSLKYLVVYDEATWGVFPASPVYVHIPVLDYDVHFTPRQIQPQPYLGSFQRKSSLNYRGLPRGRLAAPLYGWHDAGIGLSLAQYLLDWAFSDYELQAPRSKGTQWAEGPNVANKQHSGLRVDSATLAGDADSGLVTISLDVQGQNEVGQFTAQALPANRNRILCFEYKDCTFTIAGVPVLLKAFQVQIQNGLKAEYLNSFTPSILVKSQRLVSVQMTPVKNSDVYDAYRRAQTGNLMDVGLALKGLNNGTNGATTWDTVTIDVPQAVFVNADEQGGINDICTQPLHFLATKPDSMINDLTLTYASV